MSQSKVYLVPSVLSEESIETIPSYIIDAVRDCSVIFAENERTARRFLKKIYREIVIDNYEWYAVHKVEAEQVQAFRQKIKEGKNIAIISEAGCPGVADPGQLLVLEAQQMGAVIKPLVGPSSILLALMASGLNGQQFHFYGYLPIDAKERATVLRSIEQESAMKNCTGIFIETPYRNNQLLDAILGNCRDNTLVCIAAELTSPQESIYTRTVARWKKNKPDLHKKPVIFLLLADEKIKK